MKIDQIAAQLYTLRDFLKTPEDIKNTLKRVSDIGYKAVQVSGLGKIEPDNLKELVDRYNLKICTTHISYDRLANDIEKVIEEHRILNCSNVGIGAAPQEFINEIRYSEFIEFVKKTQKTLKENGLKFAYHNHDFDFMKIGGKLLMDHLFETDIDYILDTYWIQAGGASPEDWIYKVKGRMEVVHFKDMKIVNRNQVFAEIGEGNLNWNKIINACDDTNVKWAAVEQDICEKNPFDSLEISYKNLEKILK